MHILFNNTNINYTKFKTIIYKKNEIVFNDNDTCSSIGLVESGSISIKTNTYSENEFEINKINADGVFGMNLIFTNNPFYLGSGITLKETKIIFITKDELLELFKNQTFLVNYLKLMSIQSKQIQRRIKILSQNSIKDKIMFILYDNYLHNNSKIYSFKSKEELSKLLNCTRPSLSRELINLQNDNIITYNRHQIILK